MKKLLIAALLPVSALAADPTVPVGTQGFADIGIPLANGSPTGNILTSSIFTIGDLISTKAQSGVFEGLPLQDFGSFTFNINKPTSLSFGDSTWGRFTSTLIDPTEFTTHAGTTIAFFMVGNWTPGTFTKGVTGSFPSDMTISFTQTPGVDGTLSDSATFSTPAQVVSVAAPTDWLGVNALLLMGVGGVWWFTRRKQA